ncbi:neuronal acetylcholine receptor subunit alpha-6-like [Saccoglossus kowalevskii]|uniref:Neuronal acetylcholine receptor subunit alpha-2-like n=1 Tax=Saccoglossus kowalevskii TaxID=10224 RepID=A0ABM0GZR9_SACKO|nr:PREDICTED: neuronal acetylcholine receptor subunit alpha-2-like [Saccoglossus kowalevskii]
MKTKYVVVALLVYLEIHIYVGGDLPVAPEDMLLKDKHIFTKEGTYNHFVRPVYNPTDTLPVKFGLSITQLLDVDEKNQIMTTSVWMKQEWRDYRLTWEPAQYSNLSAVSLPEYTLWFPDIVLYNNADGNYGSTMSTKTTTKARIYHDGTVFYAPPTIFKSPCKINIEFFPFDEQRCTLKFGSWAYSGQELLLSLMSDEAEKEDFWENSEWEVMSVPGRNYTMKYDCCNEIYSNIKYVVIIRRRSAFYVVNLIIPCMIMSFLTLMVFYLPPDSGEKVSLSISILLALSVFQLLVADIMPPSSIAMPLIGRYLMFTEVLVMVSIIITVIVLNIHHRSGVMHDKMPYWVRRLFLEIIPVILCMRSRPRKRKSGDGVCENKNAHEMESMLKNDCTNLIACDKNGLTASTNEADTPVTNTGVHKCGRCQSHAVLCESKNTDAKILEEIQIITSHIRNEGACNEIKDDWKLVAMVIDRILLWIFTIANIAGACSILLEKSRSSSAAMDISVDPYTEDY